MHHQYTVLGVVTVFDIANSCQEIYFKNSLLKMSSHVEAMEIKKNITLCHQTNVITHPSELL